MWIDVLESMSFQLHPRPQSGKVVECGRGESRACRRVDLSAKIEVVIAPNSDPRQRCQECHRFVDPLTMIEHVTEHDERFDPTGFQLTYGSCKRLDSLVNVRQEPETHDSLLAEHAPLRHQPGIPDEERQQQRDHDACNRHLTSHDLGAVCQDIGVDQAEQKCRQ